MRYEWDLGKAGTNERKHRVTFEEAVAVFVDPNVVFDLDEAHSFNEERLTAHGRTSGGRLLRVSFTEPDESTTRIISAREPAASELRAYMERDI